MSKSNSVTLDTLPPENLGPFSPAGLMKTSVYKDKKNGRFVKIADKHFNKLVNSNKELRYPKERYIALTNEELDAYEFSAGKPKQNPIQHSLYSSEELISPQTRLADIEALPEYALIPPEQIRKLRTKQDYVDAVMLVRKNTTAAPAVLTRSSF